MLDFSELSQNGEDLELLVREAAITAGYRVQWSGRGPDGGRDLVIEERGDPRLGGKIRRWLVSCKHTARANSGVGRSVGVDDVGSQGGIVDAVQQHEATGFLLVCTTQPSSALVTRLEALEKNQGIPTHVWDSVDLERMLATPRGWHIAQRFMPISTNKAGWRIFATDEPNRFVGITRGYYIQLANRHGSEESLLLEVIGRVLDRMQGISLPSPQMIRPRGVFHNDKVTVFTWHVDYLHNLPEEEGEKQRGLVEAALNNLPDEGIFHHFEVTQRWAHFGGDSFAADHYSYYKSLPSYFRRSG
ncbi:restriction endonuclease [Streptomyces sp. NPDC088731]|uniref:restriction endonuclease n=1 Tax=Streptomyces sp. NPDC088731 TaxID=3365878 RepID=UPI00380612AC